MPQSIESKWTVVWPWSCLTPIELRKTKLNEPLKIERNTPMNNKYEDIDGLKVFYREAGDPKNPAMVLLHGFPSSSHMYRNLMATLANKFYLIAPDYPGFGNSDAPSPDKFVYTFDKLSEVVEALLASLGVTKFTLFIQDY